MISNILVPTDGSETAEKAAAYALDLAAQLHAKVTLLSVIDRTALVGRPIVPGAYTPTHLIEPLEDYLRQTAETEMGAIERFGDRCGVEIRKVIRYGHPVEEIVGEAEGSKMDLIVMGSHGRGALEAALLGSVTFGVMQKDTKIPLLVVRR